MKSSLPVLPLLSALVVGCGAAPESPTPEASPTPPVLTYHADVAPILERACVGCHVEGGIAPFALDSYEKAVDFAAAIADSTRSRRMPPWGVDNAGDCSTYKDARWLSQSDLEVLSAWASSSQAEGQPTQALEQPLEENLPKVDAVLKMEASYTPNTARNDDYRCFVVDPGLSEDAFMTGYFVRPGNSQVVHHVVVFEVGPDGTAEAEALDAAEPGPGYTCFGSPGTSYASVVVAWAPGTPATLFPEDTGVKLTAGRKLVMQMHYNTLAGDGSDQSSIEVMLEPRVDKQAFILLAGDYDLALKPGQTETRTMADIAMVDWGLPADMTLYAVFPHMHTLGTRMTGSIVSKDGSACLADIPRWDFNWQQFYFFDQPVRLTTDQLLRITCHYSTASRDSMVPWGEGTEDEMCILGIYATLGPNDQAINIVGQNRPGDVLPGEQSLHDTLPVGSLLNLGGTGTDQGRAVAAGPDGSVYVVGTTDSSTFTAGSSRLSAVGGGDGFVARFDQDGSLLWAKLVGGTARDGLLDVKVDASGAPVVCGYTSSSDLQVGGTPLPLAGENDALVIRFSPEGEPLQAVTLGGSRSESCQGLTLLPEGGLALALSFNATFQVGDVLLETPSDIGTGAVLALNEALEARWAQVVHTESNSFLRRVGSDATGRVFAAGHFYGAITVGSLTATALGDRDALVVGLEPDGTPAWVRSFGDRSWDTARALAVTPAGDLAVGGLFLGTVRADGLVLSFDGSEDAFILRLNAEGEVVDAATFGGEANAEIQSLAFTPEGQVLAAGLYEGELKVEDAYLTNSGAGDAFFVRLDEDLQVLGAQHVGGLVGEWSAYLAASPTGGAALVVNGNGDLQLEAESYGARGGGDAWLLSLDGR